MAASIATAQVKRARFAFTTDSSGRVRCGPTAPATGRSPRRKIPGFASPPRDGFALDGGPGRGLVPLARTLSADVRPATHDPEVATGVARIGSVRGRTGRGRRGGGGGTVGSPAGVRASPHRHHDHDRDPDADQHVADAEHVRRAGSQPAGRRCRSAATGPGRGRPSCSSRRRAALPGRPSRAPTARPACSPPLATIAARLHGRAGRHERHARDRPVAEDRRERRRSSTRRTAPGRGRPTRCATGSANSTTWNRSPADDQRRPAEPRASRGPPAGRRRGAARDDADRDRVQDEHQADLPTAQADGLPGAWRATARPTARRRRAAAAADACARSERSIVGRASAERTGSPGRARSRARGAARAGPAPRCPRRRSAGRASGRARRSRGRRPSRRARRRPGRRTRGRSSGCRRGTGAGSPATSSPSRSRRSPPARPRSRSRRELRRDRRLRVVEHRRLGHLEHEPRRPAGRSPGGCRPAPSRSPSRASWAADRLTVTVERRRRPLDRQRRRPAGSASNSTARPSSRIAPLSSASGMNSSGATIPRVGWRHRASASAPYGRAGRERHDRLVEHRRSRRPRCPGQLGRQRVAGDDRRVHRRARTPTTRRLPRLLGRVHRHVGVAQQVVGRARPAGAPAMPMLRRDLQRPGPRSGTSAASASMIRVATASACPGRGPSRQQDRELVAAEARRHVVRAGCSPGPAPRPRRAAGRPPRARACR